MGYCEQFKGCLRQSRMEKEAIYCNGISYLYFFSSPDYYVEMPVWEKG